MRRALDLFAMLVLWGAKILGPWAVVRLAGIKRKPVRLSTYCKAAFIVSVVLFTLYWSWYVGSIDGTFTPPPGYEWIRQAVIYRRAPDYVVTSSGQPLTSIIAAVWLTGLLWLAARIYEEGTP